jgi:hypothetical protein
MLGCGARQPRGLDFLAGRPFLLWVWAYLKTPRPDGLSDSVEIDSLVAIEKKISESLNQEFDAILCGLITTDGRREFYYYEARSEGFEAIAANAMPYFQFGQNHRSGTLRTTSVSI